MATMATERQDGNDQQVLQRSVLVAEASVGLLRGYAESALIKWDLACRIDDVQLVVSELGTNAVRARSGSQGGRMTFRISLPPGHGLILVEVTDPFPGRPQMHQAAEWEESGRGLFIVQMLAVSCGYRDEPGGGKTVCAALQADVTE